MTAIDRKLELLSRQAQPLMAKKALSREGRGDPITPDDVTLAKLLQAQIRELLFQRDLLSSVLPKWSTLNK